MAKKIAIVGKGPTSIMAPFRDREWEIWGLAWVSYPREDKTFDPHSPGYCDNDPELSMYLTCANAKSIPVIGFTDGPYAQNVPYPFEEVFAKFGHYFESSIAYLLAQALLEDTDEIGLWGVHMETRTEYAEQKANIEYLIGYGRGMGKKITVCPGAPLMMSAWQAGRYGVDLKHRWKGDLSPENGTTPATTQILEG